MTTQQRLQILASTQRSRLAELAGLDELTPELRAELDTLGTTHQDTESQLRAAIAADGDATQGGDPTVDPEVRERLELRGRASFGRYLHAALTGAPITGAEAEFQSACGVPGIPLDLFEQDRPVEVRADAPSGIPATGDRGHARADSTVRVCGVDRADARDRDAECRQRRLQRDDDLDGADGGGESEGRRTGVDRGGVVRHGGKTALDPRTADDESGGHCRNRRGEF